MGGVKVVVEYYAGGPLGETTVYVTKPSWSIAPIFYFDGDGARHVDNFVKKVRDNEGTGRLP